MNETLHFPPPPQNSNRLTGDEMPAFRRLPENLGELMLGAAPPLFEFLATVDSAN